MLFNHDSNREPLCQAHPVQRRTHRRDRVEGGALGVGDRPAYSLNASLDPVLRIGHQVDLDRVSDGEVLKISLLEVRHDIPDRAIHDREDLLPDIRVFTDRDVEVGDVPIEWGFHVAVIKKEFRSIDLDLGGNSACVHIADLAEVGDRYLILLFRGSELGLRGGDGSFHGQCL